MGYNSKLSLGIIHLMIDLGKNLKDYKNDRRYRSASQHPRCFLINTTQIEETFLYHTNVNN